MLITIISALMVVIGNETTFFYEGFVLGICLWPSMLNTAQSLPRCFVAAALWSMIVYGGHFWWIVCAAVTHAAVSYCAAFLFWALIVFYFFALTAVCFIFLCRQPLAAKVIGSVLFWIFIGSYSLCWLSPGQRYPFLNPIDGFAQRSYAVQLIHFFFSPRETTITTDMFGYLKPICNRRTQKKSWWHHEPDVYAQRLSLRFLDEQQTKKDQESLLWLGPESTFPFIFNMSEKYTMALRPLCNASIMFGTIIKSEDRLFQGIAFLHKSLIIKYYVKKTLVPGIETQWKPLQWLGGGVASLCVQYDTQQTAGPEFVDVFEHKDHLIIPRVCLEFFLSSPHSYKKYKGSGKKVIIAAFINDSWFNKQLIFHFKKKAQSIAFYSGFPVVYVGHEDLLIFE